jgi:hypothetical protein
MHRRIAACMPLINTRCCLEALFSLTFVAYEAICPFMHVFSYSCPSRGRLTILFPNAIRCNAMPRHSKAAMFGISM